MCDKLQDLAVQLILQVAHIMDAILAHSSLPYCILLSQYGDSHFGSGHKFTITIHFYGVKTCCTIPSYVLHTPAHPETGNNSKLLLIPLSKASWMNTQY